MFSINIHIFTYGIGGDESRWSWKTVSPDPKMAQFSDFPPGTVPDMYLYNSDNCHFDLLVADNSRVAVLGLISMDRVETNIKEKEVVVFNKLNRNKVVKDKGTMKEMGEKSKVMKEVKEVEDDEVEEEHNMEEKKSTKGQWTKIKGNNKTNKFMEAVEQPEKTSDSDELVLTKQKKIGHRRTGPQCPPFPANSKQCD